MDYGVFYGSAAAALVRTQDSIFARQETALQKEEDTPRDGDEEAPTICDDYIFCFVVFTFLVAIYVRSEASANMAIYFLLIPTSSSSCSRLEWVCINFRHLFVDSILSSRLLCYECHDP